MKERLFIPLAWLPKATVQAAIGSLALDTARATGAGPEEIRLGEQVSGRGGVGWGEGAVEWGGVGGVDMGRRGVGDRGGA